MATKKTSKSVSKKTVAKKETTGTDEALVELAREINELYDLDPKIATEGKTDKNLTEEILEVLNDDEDGIQASDLEEDGFTAKAKKTILALGVAIPGDVEEEDDEEEEEVEEAEEEEAEEEEAPKKKTASKANTPVYRRMYAIWDAVSSVKKSGETLEDIAEKANTLLVKKGGKDNLNETIKTMKWCFQMLEYGKILDMSSGKIKFLG